MVAAAGPSSAVGRGEQGVAFDVGQEGHEPARAALGRNREHTGDDGRLLGVVQRGVAEQGVNGRQPRVAGAHGVRAVVFVVDLLKLISMSSLTPTTAWRHAGASPRGARCSLLPERCQRVGP